MPECDLCRKHFSLRKNLYQHVRNTHHVRPQLPAGKIPCPLCALLTRTHRELRAHLCNAHQQELESEEHSFPDYEAFEGWRKRVEASSGWGYVRRISEKRLRKGEAKTHYICHRSGFHRSESSGQRRSKKSSKIGTTCPSVLEVSRSLTDGTVSVIFWKTHLGHSAESVPLRKVKRTLKQGMVPLGVCAVLPAAGVGERVGGTTPKQFIPLHLKPLIAHTVEAFLRLPYIQKVVVVCASDSLDRMLRTLSGTCALQGDRLVVTESSEGSRHHSIRAGLRALHTCCDVQPEVVVVHDGVRPFFPEHVVSDVVLAAHEHGAAGVTCPLVSTVLAVDEKGFLEHALDRSQFRASEMPQAFRYDALCRAYDKCSAHDLEHGTECLFLMQKYEDVRAKLLPAPAHLWKVTHPKDVYAAAAIIKESQSVGIVNSASWPSLVPFLEASLSTTFSTVQCIPRLTEASPHPNVVQLQEGAADPYLLLQQLEEELVRRGRQPLSVVQLLVGGTDETLNFLEFQRQARRTARQLREAGVLVYFVMHTEGSLEELSQVVRSLLFDSNPNISGNVFLS